MPQWVLLAGVVFVVLKGWYAVGAVADLKILEKK
jgi:hypothetical protein